MLLASFSGNCVMQQHQGTPNSITEVALRHDRDHARVVVRVLGHIRLRHLYCHRQVAPPVRSYSSQLTKLVGDGWCPSHGQCQCALQVQESHHHPRASLN